MVIGRDMTGALGLVLIGRMADAVSRVRFFAITW